MSRRPRLATTLALASIAATSLLVAIPGAAAAKNGANGGAKRTVWLCKPGKKDNPCEPGLSTTAFSPTGKDLGVRRVKAERHPPIDCFYVYPTVSDQKTTNANRHIDPEQRSIALYQAARYSQHCRVFAPMYRQLTLQGIGAARPTATAQGGPVLPANPREIAFRDVRAAWNDYLKHYNRGRGVVLIGHSQGSFMLRELISKVIDHRRAQRRKLVSAILLGGNVLVKKGSGVGGDFKHVRACRSDRQIGCVIAFSTFDQPVPATSIFGRTTVPGQKVLCTNPAALGGGTGRITPIYPSQPFAPGTTIALAISLLDVTLPSAGTTWVTVPNAYTARCSSAGGANVLQIRPRKGAPVFTPSPDPTWGLHLEDANIALGNLVGIVKRESRAYKKKQYRRGHGSRRHKGHSGGGGAHRHHRW